MRVTVKESALGAQLLPQTRLSVATLMMPHSACCMGLWVPTLTALSRLLFYFTGSCLEVGRRFIMKTKLIKWGFAFKFSLPSFLGRKAKAGGLHTGDSGSTCQGSSNLCGLHGILFRPTCNFQWPTGTRGRGDVGTQSVPSPLVPGRHSRVETVWPLWKQEDVMPASSVWMKASLCPFMQVPALSGLSGETGRSAVWTGISLFFVSPPFLIATYLDNNK